MNYHVFLIKAAIFGITQKRPASPTPESFSAVPQALSAITGAQNYLRSMAGKSVDPQFLRSLTPEMRERHLRGILESTDLRGVFEKVKSTIDRLPPSLKGMLR